MFGMEFGDVLSVVVMVVLVRVVLLSVVFGSSDGEAQLILVALLTLVFLVDPVNMELRLEIISILSFADEEALVNN